MMLAERPVRASGSARSWTCGGRGMWWFLLVAVPIYFIINAFHRFNFLWMFVYVFVSWLIFVYLWFRQKELDESFARKEWIRRRQDERKDELSLKVESERINQLERDGQIMYGNLGNLVRCSNGHCYSIEDFKHTKVDIVTETQYETKYSEVDHYRDVGLFFSEHIGTSIVEDEVPVTKTYSSTTIIFGCPQCKSTRAYSDSSSSWILCYNVSKRVHFYKHVLRACPICNKS